MIETNLFPSETQSELCDDNTHKKHSVTVKEIKQHQEKETQTEATKKTTIPYKTLRNYTIGAATLGTGVMITPIHHVHHAVAHAVLEPVVSKIIINPVSKMLGVEASHSHSHNHGHDTDNTTSSNIMSDIFHGVIHHLTTQIVLDQISGIWRDRSGHAGHH